MALNPNIDWPSRPRSHPCASGPEAQGQWPSEERIFRYPQVWRFLLHGGYRTFSPAIRSRIRAYP